jgi:citrate lyase beta subunit
MLDFSRVARLKGEFEAEGLTRDTLAGEVAFAARHGVGYLVKIGGCEAKADIRFLQQIGVRDVVAPMIESGFAMSKYMAMLPDGAFDHVGVTVETRHAVERIEDLLDAGTKLTEVTIGRTDLTASFGGNGVENEETMGMVKTVARAAAKRGLPTTMGGSVSAATRAMLREDGELRELITAVETRKCVMKVDHFLEDEALADAFAIETALLEMQAQHHGTIARAADQRLTQIRARM